MPTGHIALDGREYMLHNPQGYQRSSAQQMAHRIAQGETEYRNLDSWSAWHMADWTAGMGQRNAEAGGTLYSEADTRFQQQVILAPLAYPLCIFNDVSNNDPIFSTLDTTITVGPTGDYARIGVYMGTGISAVSELLLLFQAAGGVTLDVDVYDSTATSYANFATYVTPTANALYPRWHRINGSASPNAANTLWMSIAPDADITVPIFSNNNINANGVRVYNGSSWATYATDKDVLAGWGGTVSGSAKGDFFSANDIIYDGVKPYAVSSSKTYTVGINYAWEELNASYGGERLAMEGTTLYIARGASGNAYSMTTGGASATDLGYNASVFKHANGYLYRAYGNELYYRAEGAGSWQGPFKCGPSQYAIQDMAVLGNDLYVATDEGLWWFAPGEIFVGISPWPTVYADGIRMLHWQGAIYIALDEGLMRFTADGRLTNVSPLLADGMPDYVQGKVRYLASTNYNLLCVLEPNSQEGWPVVLAWNESGWHHLATLPYSVTPGPMVYDRLQNVVHVTNSVTPFQVDLPNALVNPARSEDAVAFLPWGWIETDWFWGGVREADKDWESVQVVGENIDATHTVKVYWQDIGSTDWEYLGEITSESQELRWSNYATRPNSDRLKLGILLEGTLTTTPIIRNIRVKYHTMLHDWWIWQIPVEIVGDTGQPQELIEGVNPYTRTQMLTHLDTLTKQVPPFIMRDRDGTQYEVKVKDSRWVVTHEEMVDGTLEQDGVYTLTVEQMVNAVYTP